MSDRKYTRHPNHKVNFPENETWEDIEGYEGFYQVSTYGRLRTKDRTVYAKNRWGTIAPRRYKAKMIKPSCSSGYMLVWLHKSGVSLKYTVHSLVLSTFIGPRPKGLEGCHNDGDFTNNRLENLRWDTHQNNHQDRIRHGTNNYGVNNGSAKLTDESVIKMRKMYATGKYLMRELAAMFGLSSNAARAVIRGLLWGHVKYLPASKFGKGRHRLNNMGRR